MTPVLASQSRHNFSRGEHHLLHRCSLVLEIVYQNENKISECGCKVQIQHCPARLSERLLRTSQRDMMKWSLMRTITRDFHSTAVVKVESLLFLSDDQLMGMQSLSPSFNSVWHEMKESGITCALRNHPHVDLITLISVLVIWFRDS